ncbi:MAG: hypothetical protein AB1489_17790 [Acidobacteriota bacterium]
MGKKVVLPVSLFVALVFVLNIAVSGNSSKAVPLPLNPRENATVTMTFDGLMALCMGNSERVSVGILNVHHHLPMLTVAKIVNGQRSIVTTLKDEQLRGTTYIEVEGGTANVGKYLSASMQNDVNDFRWNIDLEGDLHQRQLYVQEEKLFGKIHIGAGLFYARNLSEEKVRFFAADGSGKALPFNRRVAEPAAKIDLAAGQALIIRGVKESIHLAVEKDVYYEVAITNEPPAEMANIDHFQFYYEVMGEKITPYIPVAARKTSSAPWPLFCGSGIFSKSQLN